MPRFDPAAPPVETASRPPDFSGVDILEFTYRTDQNAVAEILPAALEVDEDVTATVMFVSYGFSGAGPYLEVVHRVHCRFRDEEVSYVPHIYLTNEPAMLAGREAFGYPKLLADIDFDPSRRSVDAMVTGRLERPAGVELATAQFKPFGRIAAAESTALKQINLRVIPSAVPGQDPSVAELVPTLVTVYGGENWLGQGSLRLTGASDFSPLHRVPIVENLGATLLTQATMSLTLATETYPL
ncbi:hypothetical protein BS297_27450 [Rhodococcus erythropolis]|uniref:Acetoacetate decarboxylase n=1 Tax=Rhodococcus erythropolis TaxID=1833 RepID=A0A5N5DVM3_RHOER|nr:hypothetical protein BS297_27450 [Rhodococcus erythropolis]